MRNGFLCLSVVLMVTTLPACGGAGDPDADGNGSISLAEAADATEASGIKPQPGLYRVTSQLKGMEIPGVPAEMSGEGLGFTNTSEHCLTQEEVDNGFEEMMKEGQEGECSYNRFDLVGGTIDGEMVCETEDSEMRMEFTGTATETSSDVTATMTSTMPGLGEGTMTLNVKQERIGDCTA